MITILPHLRPGRRAEGTAEVDLGNVDAAWEQIQESALRASHAGREELAARNWERAMTIARRHFGPIDPRLAASLTNHGHALRRRGDQHGAERHLRQALHVWNRGWRWVDRMASEDRPENGHAAVRPWLDTLVQRGYAITQALHIRDELPEYRLNLWNEYRPAEMGDLRRLMGAVLLIASRPRTW